MVLNIIIILYNKDMKYNINTMKKKNQPGNTRNLYFSEAIKNNNKKKT